MSLKPFFRRSFSKKEINGLLLISTRVLGIFFPILPKRLPLPPHSINTGISFI